MRREWRCLALACLATVGMLRPSDGYGQSTEDRFHDLFVTAGYATAFGAALGAAALSFTAEPEQHLKYVAVGASLGFIGGSAMGTYIIFSPIFTGATNDDANTAPRALTKIPAKGLLIQPTFAADWKLASVATGMTVMRF